MSHEIPMFYDLAIILACSLPVLFLSRRIGLPPIAGFVLTGILIGPYGLGLIENLDHVESSAEVGVILLLFIVGLELSLSGLKSTPGKVYLAAVAQVVLTTALVTLVVVSLGLSFSTAIIAGFVVAVSSSALVLKGLADKGELNSPMGQMVTTICIVQDLAIVPMMMTVGILAAGQLTTYEISARAGLVAAWLVSLYLLGRWVLPMLLRWLVRIQAAEAILLFAILVLLVVGAISSVAGLSVALGAFAAGVILSENEFSAHIYSQVQAFSQLFSSLFFVSVGMLLDLRFVVSHFDTVLAVSIAVLLVKALVIVAVSQPLGLSLKQRVQGGFYLAQVGEFSFLLLSAAVAGRLVTHFEFQYLIAASSLTLAVTPLVMQWAPHVAYHAGMRIGRDDPGAVAEPDALPSRPKPAVLIVGYGLNGHNVARVLRESGLYYEIIEFNPQAVRIARLEGEIIHYGDATHADFLSHLGIEDFDSVVLAISDPAATRRSVVTLHRLNPDAHLIVRTKYVAEVEQLERLGAKLVVPEEFETSLRIFVELLTHYHIPPHIVAAQVEAVRSQSYGTLRGRNVGVDRLAQILMKRLVEAVPITENSKAHAKTLRALGFTNNDRCQIIALLRDGCTVQNNVLETELLPNDLVVLYGDHAALDDGVHKLSGVS
ncbi:MAG: cation:proton antiporter [Calditrichaeota bacterium]|nr:cation:proton antiporter [Calditrichota bacterium]MCB9391771.1 cation:proton antiporter [Calditrichota bacterium]